VTERDALVPDEPTFPRVRGRRLLGLSAAAALLLGGTGYGVFLWRYWQTHVSTDDAFVEARVAPVSAKVSGTVIEVRVADNQQVREGDVLVRLDPRDYQVKLEQARAAVLMAQGGERGAISNVPLSDETTQSQVRQAEAGLEAASLGVQMAESLLQERQGRLRARQAAVAAARAEREAAEATFERARLDRDRAAKLLKAELVAQQDFDHAEATFKTSRAAVEAARSRLEEAGGELLRAEAEVRSQTAALAQARRRVEEAQAFLDHARSRRREVRIRRAEAETASGRMAEALASLREAELRLEYTTIRAPVSGRITKKNVEVGQVVQPGQPLLAVVNLEELWVVANFKETDLALVHPGQPATIRVDRYPGIVFRARVDSVQAGTGSRFALLPPENASGNFVKVVQRIPVKLALEPGENGRHLLVPGMSVIPTIELR
jgi:membrane fusion protein (multidrug efflux system)